MNDYIKISPPYNQCEQLAKIIPEKDGFFEFTVRADATGNGHALPIIWADILIDGKSIEHRKTAWQDGDGWIDISDVHPLKGGVKYEISAISGNENATAKAIKLNIRRTL